MRESATFQAISQEGVQIGRQEGRREGELNAIQRLGLRRLGQLTPEQSAQLEAMTDFAQLHAILDAMTTANCWAELLSVQSKPQ